MYLLLTVKEPKQSNLALDIQALDAWGLDRMKTELDS